MPPFFNRIGVKLALAVLVFILALALVTNYVVISGFERTQQGAEQRSAQGLEAQGREALFDLTRSEANVMGGKLQPAAIMTRSAVQYLADVQRLNMTIPWDDALLMQGEDGVFYDANPSRRTDLLAEVDPRNDPAVKLEMHASAALDGLFPAFVRQYPDAAALYYLSAQGFIRYFPVIDLASRIGQFKGLTQDPAFSLAGPEADPSRQTIWLSAYQDTAGRGLMVTVSSPVYDQDRYIGAVAVDISLANLVARLNVIQPTANAFAFLTDDQGHLVAAAPKALEALLGSQTPLVVATPGEFLGIDLSLYADESLLKVITEMRAGQSGVERLDFNQKPFFIAYSPLEDIGWSLALVAPIEEITAQASSVSAAIRSDAQTTVRTTLLTVGVFFFITILGSLVISRVFLNRPINALVEGVRAISAGRLDVSIPIVSHDELGSLAASFNHMTGELMHRTQDLNAANASLIEREEQYRRVFESTTDGLILYSLEGSIVDANPAACQMHGYDYVTFVQLEPAAFLHPDYQARFQDFVETVMHSGAVQGQTINIRKDGTQFYTDVRGTRLIFRGKPHILWVVRDVTERVQAYQLLEQRVAERTLELSTLLDLSHSLASTLELEPLYRLVLDQLGLMVDYRCANIYMLQENQFVLADAQGAGSTEQAALFTQSLNNGAARSFLMGLTQPLILLDVLDAGEVPKVLQPMFQQMKDGKCGQTRAWMWVPLRFKDEVSGGVSLGHPEPNHYTTQHSRLAMAIANQAAVMIENARLYEQAQNLAALEERQRLARELHDSVSQALYGIALGARTARTLLDRDPTKASDPLDYVLSLAEAGLAEMRALIFELRPESLEKEGLVVALTKQADSLRSRHGIEVATELCPEPEIPLAVKETLYRIGQEAMNNVIKHAQASQVKLQLSCRSGELVLEVQDNGQGFDPNGDFPGHLGLKSMRERAR
jgi:PAS domain S-box-containing protein